MRKLLIFTALFLAVCFYFNQREFPVHQNGIVVISGASTGIGFHAAFELANQGYYVIAGVRNEKALKNLEQEAKRFGGKNGKVEPFVFDVTKEETIENLYAHITTVAKKEGLLLHLTDSTKGSVANCDVNSCVPKIVAIVNNAGIGYYSSIEMADIQQARDMFEVNFWGSVRLTRRFLPIVRANKARLVFVSSVAGLVSASGWGYYSASKHALESLVDALRLEMNAFDVSVSGVLPGYINTSFKETMTVNQGMSRADIDRLDRSSREFQVYDKIYSAENYNNAYSFRWHSYDVSYTTDAIAHAITSAYPRSRYFVGPLWTNYCFCGFNMPVVIIPYLKMLPDRLLDLIKHFHTSCGAKHALEL